MMDPMKVDIAVSPETDARVNYNDLVRVFTPNGDQLEGYVYLKDTFAECPVANKWRSAIPAQTSKPEDR